MAVSTGLHWPPARMTLDGLYLHGLGDDPERALLLSSDGAVTISWREFDEYAGRMAAVFRDLGVARGDRVALVSHNHPHYVTVMFALNRIGATLVPVNPDLQASEVEYILRHAQVCGVVCSASCSQMCDAAMAGLDAAPWKRQLSGDAPVGAVGHAGPGATGIENNGTDADTLLAASASAAPILAAQGAGRPDDTAVIIYTSGTTGFPKGVMHSQSNYVKISGVAHARVGLQGDGRVMLVLPLFHVNALFYSIGGVFAAGASAVITPRFSASTFWSTAARFGATQVNVMESVGAILQTRSRTEFDASHRIRTIYGVRPAYAQTFTQEFGVKDLITGFGMSEIPGFICNPWIGKRKLDSMGVIATQPGAAAPWGQARVVDDDGRDVPGGATGELWVRAEAIMTGYFNDPVQTAAAFDDGWFKTGDLVRQDEEGYFFFVSRKKDIIRRRGENIAGAEIDRIVGTHPAVAEVAAFATPSELGEDEVMIAVVRRPGMKASAQELAAWCRERLAAHKVPRFVAFVDALPHTQTHKVAKNKLRADESLRANAVDLSKAEETPVGKVASNIGKH